jgi:hypothetical protein
MKFVRVGPNDSEKYDKLIETMPVFVKIYSPNCGHCVNMKEAWDALENSDDIKNYDIAIIEVHEGATNNITSPSGKIDQGLPTIRAVKLNGKKWKEYEGDRSVEDMVKFIKDNFNDKKTMSGGKIMLKRRMSSSRKTKRKVRGGKSKGIKRKSKRKSFSKSKKGRKY